MLFSECFLPETRFSDEFPLQPVPEAIVFCLYCAAFLPLIPRHVCPPLYEEAGSGTDAVAIFIEKTVPAVIDGEEQLSRTGDIRPED